jgi:CRP-like cAMP-binding protein
VRLSFTEYAGRGPSEACGKFVTMLDSFSQREVAVNPNIPLIDRVAHVASWNRLQHLARRYPGMLQKGCLHNRRQVRVTLVAKSRSMLDSSYRAAADPEGGSVRSGVVSAPTRCVTRAAKRV